MRRHDEPALTIRRDDHDIHTDVDLSFLFRDQSVGQSPQLLLFARAYRLRGFDHIAAVTSAAHFDNHMGAVGIERDDVGFAPAATVVALDDLIAARLQVSSRQLLTGGAEVAPAVSRLRQSNLSRG